MDNMDMDTDSMDMDIHAVIKLRYRIFNLLLEH